jgi:acyl-CoA synthetase (AMP-forming)/AMP-acid ligase II
MAHQTGFLYGMYLAFYLGAKAVYLDRWDPGLAAAAIRENAVTFVQAALPFLVDLVRLSEPPSIRLFVATGSNIPGAVVRRLGPRLQGQIVKAWGSTETGLATAGVLTESQWKPWEHDGRAMPGATVLIRDSDRHTVPPGTEGRLWVRTDSMFVEYLNHPEWKNQALDPEGFFDTGDLAVMNFEGDMAITGRAKDVINRGGEKIPVVELEEILYQCPGVADVAIVAMPDERLGERACAYIVATEGTKAPGLQELRAYLEGQQFSKVYWPERVEILKELPRTASGKVQKFKLRQMAATAVAVPTAES